MGELIIGDSQIGVRFHYPGFLERVSMMIHEPRRYRNSSRLRAATPLPWTPSPAPPGLAPYPDSPAHSSPLRTPLPYTRRGARTTASLIEAKERAKAASRTRAAQDKWGFVKTLARGKGLSQGQDGAGGAGRSGKENSSHAARATPSPRRLAHGGAQIGRHEFNSDPRSAAASASSMMISSDKIMRVVKGRLLNR